MPKRNKKYILEKKVENQGKSISQLLGEIEQLKSKTTRYMEQAHLYRGEKLDLMTKCNELEEELRQKEKTLTSQNKDIDGYQQTIKELHESKKIAEEHEHDYFKALCAKEEICRGLRAEIHELKKPWWKKVLHIG